MKLDLLRLEVPGEVRGARWLHCTTRSITKRITSDLPTSEEGLDVPKICRDAPRVPTGDVLEARGAGMFQRTSGQRNGHATVKDKAK